MIKITERWSVYRDPYQWVLVETYLGKPRKVKDVMQPAQEQTRQTYHPSLDMACRYAADKDCEGATTLREVEQIYTRMGAALRGPDSAYERTIKQMASDISEMRTALRRNERAA